MTSIAREDDQEGDWAERECGHADLGDARLTKRLITLLGSLAQNSQASIPGSMKNWASIKAAYRFFSNRHIEHEQVLKAHALRSVDRMLEHKVVLAVQDTTEFSFEGQRSISGLGPLQVPHGWGMLCHGTLAFSPERVPLGVLDMQMWSRESTSGSIRATRRARSIQDKESRKWLDSIDALVPIRALLPNTTLVSVADREADVFEFFTRAREQNIEVLVRASWDRALQDSQLRVNDALEQAPVIGIHQLSVPRQKDRPARLANLQLRVTPLEIKAPRNGSARTLPTLRMWGILAREIAPPQGTEPIEWKLLSSLPVHDMEQALEKLDWYAARWGIELWHKVLKSGCNIEARQLETFDRIERLCSVFAIVAWRILYATFLSRNQPDLPCTVLLEQDEWQALCCAHAQDKHQIPSTPPPLREAIRLIAMLGGFIGRASDGEPGIKTIWLGMNSLIHYTKMYSIMRI